MIKLRTPSKKSGQPGKQATTVHLEPVPSEKQQDKKEERPAHSEQKGEGEESAGHAAA